MQLDASKRREDEEKARKASNKEIREVREAMREEEAMQGKRSRSPVRSTPAKSTPSPEKPNTTRLQH